MAANRYTAEFSYLFELIQYRLNISLKKDFHQAEPAMPAFSKWNKNFSKFIAAKKLGKNEALLLLIAITPHVYPHLFNDASDDLIGNNDFPRIGGTKGKNFRGFLPTGETACFIMAGEDQEKRREVQNLFAAAHFFSEKKVLWLETLPEGEPPLHGSIIVSSDYVELLINGKHATPHFSISFPAKHIITKLAWEDLVVSDELKEQLLELESWKLHNDQLMQEWSMENRLKKGYRALFYGPPGTGKTFAAGLLANRLDKQLYKIDLSMVVSKYVGETEKNLELLFARAEDKDWILFFDEADAIFGKRTNVKDSNDKYANQEVSYLLQRIEDYSGMVILATNMKNNIDDAFLRRFNAILRFSLPDEDQRTEIWNQYIPNKQDKSDNKNGSKSEKVRQMKNYVLFGESYSTGERPEIINIPEKVKKYQLSGGSIVSVAHYAGIKGLEKFKNDKMAEAEFKKKPIPDEQTIENEFFDVGEEANTRPQMTIYLTDVLEGIKREFLKEGKPFNF